MPDTTDIATPTHEDPANQPVIKSEPVDRAAPLTTEASSLAAFPSTAVGSTASAPSATSTFKRTSSAFPSSTAPNHATGGVDIDHAMLKPLDSPRQADHSSSDSSVAANAVTQSNSSSTSSSTFTASPPHTVPSSGATVRRTPYGSILSLPTLKPESAPAVILRLPASSSVAIPSTLSPQSELSLPPSSSNSTIRQSEQMDTDVIDSRTQDLINALSSEPPARSLRPRKKVNYALLLRPYARPLPMSGKASVNASLAASRPSAKFPPLAHSLPSAPAKASPLQFPVSGPIEPTLIKLEQMYLASPLAAPDPR